MALTRNKVPHKVHQRNLNIVGANAGEKFFVGGYLLREAATLLGTKVVAAGNVPLGVLVETMFPDDPDKTLGCHLDNTLGTDGVVATLDDGCLRTLRFDQTGEYAFEVEAGTPKAGEPAYLVDDGTVTATASATGIIAGNFTRPAPEGGWFVDISKRRVAGETFVPQADVDDLTGTPGTADGALTALPTLTDTPATADALRDDLHTNWKPAIDNNIADLQADTVAIKDALRAAGILIA